MVSPTYSTSKVLTLVGALILAVCVLALVVMQQPASAAFPGANGRIAFISASPTDIDSTRSNTYTVLPDGTGRVQLTSAPGNDRHPAWSPDGTKVALEIDNDLDGLSSLYVMDADGSDLRRLPNTVEGDSNPAWSPDGTKILFSNRTRNGVASSIYVMNLDGSGVRRLTHPSLDGTPFDLDPAWSPDGKKIAFARVDFGGAPSDIGIWLMNPDGSGQVNLTRTLLPIDEPDAAEFRSLQDPEWSPDGTTIAFGLVWTCRCGDHILKINSDGTGLVDLRGTLPQGVRQFDPAWSPDGTTIAFEARTTLDCQGEPDPDNCPTSSDIWVMNPDATNQRNLTNTPDISEVQPDWQALRRLYPFSGFFSPVDNPPVLNVLKAGNTVPVRFSLGGDEGLDIFAEGYPKSRQISCASSAPLDGIEQTVSAGQSSLSYDATTDRYTYLWKTKQSWSGTCRRLVVQLDDGSVHRANFKFR